MIGALLSFCGASVVASNAETVVLDEDIESIVELPESGDTIFAALCESAFIPSCDGEVASVSARAIEARALGKIGSASSSIDIAG